MDDTVRRDRKYKAFWVVFFISTMLFLFERIDSSQWVEIVSIVFGLYMAGNVGEHASNAWESKREEL